MPHVLITTQVFPPETHPTAVMVRELAEHLAATGWRVTVAAGLPHHPHGELYPEVSAKLWQRQDTDGYRVLRAWHPISPDRRIPVRASMYLAQAAAAGIAGGLADEPDLVLVYGPPLVGAAIGWILAKRHGARMANVIYDLHPDIAIETGKLENPWAIRVARSVEQFQYRVADRTIVLSEGFKQSLLGRGVPETKISIVPVWLDPKEIVPMSRDNAWRHENGIPADKFVVLYAGTIGLVSGATMVAEAAATLVDQDDILFVFVGEGETKAPTMARVRSLGLDNVRFLPFQPRSRLSEVQATADIGLITLAPGRGRTSVPSKVLGYMAAGRPVLASVDEDSDTAAQILGAMAGVVCPADSPGELAEQVVRLKHEPEMRAKLGENGRNHVVHNLSKAVVLNEMARVLAELVDGP